MKKAVITGTNSGFGFLTTLELLEANYYVIATMRMTADSSRLLAEARKRGLANNLEIYRLDVTELENVLNFKDYLAEQHTHIDVLINNAGYCQGGFIDNLADAQWRHQLDVNVNGVFSLTHHLLPLLKLSDRAQIINIGSISGYIGLPGMSAYCASKFALAGFSESLRIELLKDNIFVSLVAPASFKTAIWSKGLAQINETQSTLKKTVLNYALQARDKGQDPKAVANLIKRICQSRKPKLYYTIGKGAHLLLLVKRLLPWRTLEYFILKRLAK
ncbi:NADP-dependent 3-hydroxy acid dehydrogenase YdfG [Amphibacillus marinus]|uniref:NADP-dependent 3-hydroxy acid dehydrogenase YdfG n=1 Tax=Amphibacillus marinus TaxID=872970 RepID=A0A1H8M9S1_9BACI|nr:SDR family NAD(P)-dependent oxidoreductase [Amphibacillus marinus]SEO13968.1 NADP-dependent 3-hydroxy acid dehydrogenase YdfG [Amphibacillus marinus]